MIFLLLTTALASTCASPLPESEFRALVDEAKTAIEAGDTDKHQRISSSLEQRVPCLHTQLPSRPWADYLITLATVQYAQDNPAWSESLAVALDVVPNHPDTPPHLLEEFVYPPPDLSNPQDIPPGTVIAIDGKIVLNHIPPLKGMHIAQIARVGQWETRLLRNESFPLEWLQGTKVAPTKVASSPAPNDAAPSRKPTVSWGSVSLVGGFGDWQQSSLMSSFTEVIHRDSTGTSFGFNTNGQQHLFGSVGVFWTVNISGQDADTPTGSTTPRRLVGFGGGFAGLSVFDVLETPLSVWVGAGVTSTRVDEASVERPLLLPHYLVGLALHTSGSIPIDVTVGGGWAPWGGHAQLNGGATILQVGPVGLRAGLEGSFASATLGDAKVPQPSRGAIATSSRWTAGLCLGISWGNRTPPAHQER